MKLGKLKFTFRDYIRNFFPVFATGFLNASIIVVIIKAPSEAKMMNRISRYETQEHNDIP